MIKEKSELEAKIFEFLRGSVAGALYTDLEMEQLAAALAESLLLPTRTSLFIPSWMR